MATKATSQGLVFRVLDIMGAPHGGWILRLKLEGGEFPGVKAMKGRRMDLVSDHGIAAEVQVAGFPMFGGRPKDDRVARSGRIDVHVTPAEGPAALPPQFLGVWRLQDR
jgi:hypothetical protein